MPISLQSIREFKSANMIWDDQKGVMKSAGFWQKFNSFFNIGHAREQNAATLAAIKNAVVDSLPADDLKALAAQKIDQIRTDRVIGAAQIRGILDDLSRLGGPSEAAIKERSLMHLSVADFSNGPLALWDAKDEIASFISNHIAHDPNVQRDPDGADIRRMTSDLFWRVREFIAILQGYTTRSLDANLLRTVAKNLEGVAWKTDADGNSVERPDANDRIAAIPGYWAAAQTRAKQLPPGNRDEFKQRAQDLLNDLLHLPDPYDRLATLIRTVPLEALNSGDFATVLTHLNSLYDQSPADAGTGPMLTDADILPAEDDEFSTL